MVFLFGDPDGIRYGATRLHAHVGENRSPNAFLPLRSLLFESLSDNKTKTPPSKEDGVFIW